MSHELEYPICRTCAPYVERVVADESFAQSYMRFLGVRKVKHPHQSSGAFSCVVPREVAPDDLAERFSDFGTFCQFLGQRIRELRSHETSD